jgi:hypothetical protein
MIKELHHGANVLLAHFHYCCKGFRPFTLEWNPAESISMAVLDTKQVRFVRRVCEHQWSANHSVLGIFCIY